MAGSSGRQKAASRPTKASKRVPAEKFIRGERTPLEHLLALMNDSSHSNAPRIVCSRASRLTARALRASAPLGLRLWDGAYTSRQ